MEKNTIAAVLSFFLPGLGQVYKGHILRGIAFFIGFWLMIGGAFIICCTAPVALVIWAYGIYDAVMLKPRDL